MITIILFIFGLAVGSFLNVVSLRYDPESGRSVFSRLPIGGRSRCPSCRQTLAWYDLIPIFSFLFLRGKCRYCGAKIAWQYPIIEIISGFAALLPLYFYGQYSVAALTSAGENVWPLWIFIAVWTLALYIFILLSVIDWRFTIIPDELNVAIGILGIIKIASFYFYDKFSFNLGTFLDGYAQLFGFRENILTNHAVAAAFGILFFGTIIYVTRGRGMGMGDLKLAAALGLLLGWPDILVAILLSFMLGASYSIFKIVFGGLHLKDAVPFGPFIVLGVIVTLFWGADILRAYFTLFNF